MATKTSTKRSYKQKRQQEVLDQSEEKKISSNMDKNVDIEEEIVVSGCSTPKSERHKIPELLSCPPPPKKRKVSPSCSTVDRSPIAFFAPPDLELFFFFAFRNNGF
ncbi:hypothetical protein TIFTF001_023896 [Ficus carica]|uniref:Uncharacterized protein n=1 Tax=Ficus carica TaxID=3494 RepID=A0AA88AH20_FICCA|nr:hypothetical protein TIFTF001_023896 [Ficus carica]